jgi:hypothetical protein
MAIPGNIGSKKSSSNPFAMAASKGSMPTPGISAASPATRKEITRQQFFKGRPDVSDDRLVRRQTQADELRAFKQGLTIAPGTTNLYQEQAPTFNPMTGRYERTTLADKSRELALKYGPTFSEIGSDIGYGLGSIAKGAGDFIGRGGVIGSVLSGLYDKFKSGTQQGIETVGSLYDNLRKNLGGGKPPVASYGGSSDIRVTEQPMFPYNFETMIKPKPDPLQPSEMSEEQFMESYPELYSGNPLFKQQTYQPIKVQDVDPSRLLVQNFNIPTVEDVVEQLSDYYNAYEKGVNLKTPVGDLNLNPTRQEIFLGNSLPIGEDRSVFYTGSMNPNDMSYDVGIGTQLPYGVDFKLGASSNDVPGIGFSKRLGPINAGLGFSEEGSNLNLNTFVDPIRALYPTSSIGLPLNIGATVSDIGKIIPNISLMKQFKKGGSVDKYAGLGYKLK